MEEDEISSFDSHSVLSVAIGRAMTALLSAHPRKLEDAIARFSPSPKRASPVSLDESLLFLYNFIKDASEKDQQLGHVLIPMIEQSLKSNKSKYGGNQSMMLLNWLFRDELLLQSIARDLTNIVVKKQDRYITLGWCILVRSLLEYDFSNSTGQSAKHGIREKHIALLRSFTPCIAHLISIVCSGSIPQDGHELPTRLSVSTADCVLTITESLLRKHLSSDSTHMPNSSDLSVSNRPVNMVSFDSDQARVKSTVKSIEIQNSLELELLLWDHLSELIILLQKLLAWSRKSRPLHAEGLGGVLKWLQELKGTFGCSQDEAGLEKLKNGVLILSSCWKHYGMLLHLEDHNFMQHSGELLDQYLSGIQFYMENCSEEISEHKDSSVETRKFFLNCILLLLGRLGSKQLENMISEYGLKISQVLMSQLHCVDEDVIDGAVQILKAVMFRRDSSSSRSVLSQTKQMNAVLPLLLNLLDERGGTARAAVMLTAEYCSIDDHCFREIMMRLASVNVVQRKNSIDVISELIHISYPVNVLSDLMWQDIAKHLLERMEDEEFEIRMQVFKLLPMIDPALVLPALVRLVCSSSKGVRSNGSDALLAILKNHSERHEVICMLLDCLSNFGQSAHLCKASTDKEDEFEMGTDHVLRLIPEWSKSVKDWNVLVGPLIDKMFAEPSNATIVRFLSHISEHLGEAADLVFHYVLLHTKGQEDIDETFFSQREKKTVSSSDSVKFQETLFDRLSPLLVIRLLPLRSFDNINSSNMYGEFLNENMSDYVNVYIKDRCVAALLLNRAFGKFEFEDVRKLAAELCGRIHPLVLLPIISTQLDHARSSRDMLKIKSCLFSLCNSLVVRGKDLISHPDILKIRKTVECILALPSLDGDEVSKAQHGCIDCLALMIYAELQVPPSFKNMNISTDGVAVIRHSFVDYVIHRLTDQHNELCSGSKLDLEKCMYGESPSHSFRLCMANVLISACQKISDSCRKPFAQETLPILIRSIQVIADSEIRAACIQVLFSAVYHLKSAVLPYAPELFKISVKALRKGSDKERVVGTKLMASLMASEDVVITTISHRFVNECMASM